MRTPCALRSAGRCERRSPILQKAFRSLPVGFGRKKRHFQVIMAQNGRFLTGSLKAGGRISAMFHWGLAAEAGVFNCSSRKRQISFI
jgi:hypothetical protein